MIGLALGSQAAMAAYQAQQSKKRESEYSRKAADQERAFEASRQAIKDIDFSPGSGIYDLEQQRKMQAELMGSQVQERSDEREARALSALGDSPRQMNAMLPRFLEQSENALQKANLQVGDMKVKAGASTVQAEEAGADKSRQRDMMLGQLDLQRAGQSFDTFTEGAMGERAMRAEMLQSLGSEVGETVGAYSGMKSAEAVAADNRSAAEAALRAQMLSGESGVTPPIASAVGGAVKSTEDSLDFGEEDINISDDDVVPLDNNVSNLLDMLGNFKDGGYIGEQGGVTEGEFDHDTNKIALVDQESGEKVGEGTGGEAFLNPDQFANTIEVKAIIDNMANSPNATKEIKRAAEMLRFLDGEQFQEA